MFAASRPAGRIPIAALAGVLTITAIRMGPRRHSDLDPAVHRADAATYLITAIVTISADLIIAVIIGVVTGGSSVGARWKNVRRRPRAPFRAELPQ